MTRRTSWFVVLLLLSLVPSASAAWKAGAAKINITPDKLMWMSGYGGRNHPAEGKLTDLWAKALVIEDEQGGRAVLVTLDLVGIDRDTSLAVCKELEQTYQLRRDQVALNTSHTHCGPVVGRNLGAMYFMDDEQWKLVDDYAVILKRKIVAVVGQALQQRAPAVIEYSEGTSDFAVNRRTNKEAEVPQLREQGALKGPVDHRVPVLAVKDANGKLLSVAFGYACHATVLSFYQWCGDYPGYAMAELESQHPGAIALFWAGCGADQNPLPRREVSLAQSYGKRLTQSVNKVLQQPLKPLTGQIATRYAEVAVPLDTLPTREQLLAQTMDANKYIAQRAKILLENLNKGQPLSATYPYPVQVWHLGPELRWVVLGGEVVVDYSLRIAKELGDRPTWIAGYSNDVMAYIPSVRVLKEGGYEGASSMIYYGLPTVWAPPIEELILGKVHELAK
ncbi:MAG: neutral/alkaline non-lysosomal ceramidase N-terminal domain-containing protein [Planctomycetaceae bacterium]|nr:neutral/alkaline non-lysosomal ceramidase N-terminal domain-containing protein [Planctomycetaceae bacterium]